MVAIRHYEADRLLAKPQAHLGFYLFFGADAGLVNERLRRVLRTSVDDPSDAFQLVRIEGDELSSDPGRLADEVNTIGLFGGRRAAWIRAGSKNLIPAFEGLIDSLPQDMVVLVEAGALKRDSALRKLFERGKHAAAIECAHDDEGQIQAIIKARANEEGMAIDQDTARLASRSLGADRLTTRSELEKLLLYAHGNAAITEDDVRAVIADASALNLDAALHAAFGGRMEQVEGAVQKVFSTGGDPGVLLGMAMRHAVMLHRAKLDIARGMPRDAAIEKSQRRAFIFLPKDEKGQFDIWTIPMLSRAIEILGRAIADCRREARLAEAIAARTFWTLTNACRRNRLG